MALGDFDAEGMPRQRVAELLVVDLQKALAEYRQVREPRVLRTNSGYALLFTLLAAALLYGVVRLRRWGMERLSRRFVGGQGQLKIQSVHLVQSRQLWLAVRALVNAGTTLTMLVIAYLYLSRVLRLYPWTRPLADDLFLLFLKPLQVMAHAVLGAVPGSCDVSGRRRPASGRSWGRLKLLCAGLRSASAFVCPRHVAQAWQVYLDGRLRR